MQKILINYIGNHQNRELIRIFGKKYEIINLIDNTGKNLHCTDCKEANTYTVDFNHLENYKDLIYNLKPFKTLIIYSAMDPETNGNLYVQVNRILTKIFLSIKCFYTTLLQQRNVNVWILEPLIIIENDPALQVIINTFKSGIIALTKIAALELSRKKIIVNYIGIKDQFEKLEKIITWVNEQSDTYLTAQELLISTEDNAYA
ncbi:MAG: hypothetical protein JXB88_07125 [Spirochaetales bacterium]|nr:hypothetical protein [Spirochaetales bacterium]